MESSVEVMCLEVPCDRDAPGTVRQALLDLDSLGWVLGDVMLVASELVTNAVLHSGCLSQHALTVRGCLGDGQIRISVWDPGLSGGSAQLGDGGGGGDTDGDGDGDGRAGGWGLRIVDQLAAEWGSERGEGYLVWADMLLTA
jgi:anti-sigma regulatory factor (Ser/Thr protein kinase)